MSNKIHIILCLAIICFVNISNAKFVTTYSVNSPMMQKIGEWVDKDTIVFIDLDDTLMTPKSSMFLHSSNPYKGFIDSMLYLGQKNTRYNDIVAKWYQQREIKLVDDAWPEYIQKLKDKGASVYGMCKMPLRLINIEEKRYLESKGLNIIFTENIYQKEILTIEKQRAWFSFFYKGIIFTGPYSRSHTLLEFLKVTEVPKKIVFISNAKKEVKRVEKNLRVFDMDFYNVLYLGVKEIQGQLNEQVIKFQQKELIDNGVWLEDDAAQIEFDKYLEEQKSSAALKEKTSTLVQ